MTEATSSRPAYPVLFGDEFRAAYKAGEAAAFLYRSVAKVHDKPADFASVEGALDKLAARVAWRLMMTGARATPDHPGKVVTLASDPDLHVIEVTELLALVFRHPPIDTYDRNAPGATFWNWWDWTAGARRGAANDNTDNKMTDLRRADRLAAGAAAVAMFRNTTQPMGRC